MVEGLHSSSQTILEQTEEISSSLGDSSSVLCREIF